MIPFLSHPPLSCPAVSDKWKQPPAASSHEKDHGTILSSNFSSNANAQHGRFAPHIEALSSASGRFLLHSQIAEPWWHHLTYLVTEVAETWVLTEPEYVGDLLCSVPANKICEEVLGCAPVGLRTALQKVRNFPLPIGSYQKLLIALGDRSRAKIIAHTTRITPSLIDVITRLRPECLSQCLVAAVQTEDQAESLCYLIDSILTFLPEEQLPNFWRSIQSINDYKEMGEWFKRWIGGAPLPLAPWAGNDLLHPIQTVEQMQNTAREFGNCLDKYILSTLATKVAFYLWLDGPRVVICIHRDPFFKWSVGSMEGTRFARHVTPATRQDILTQFGQASIRPKPSLNGLHLSEMELDVFDF